MASRNLTAAGRAAPDLQILDLCDGVAAYSCELLVHAKSAAPFLPLDPAEACFAIVEAGSVQVAEELTMGEVEQWIRDEAAMNIDELRQRAKAIGYEILEKGMAANVPSYTLRDHGTGTIVEESCTPQSLRAILDRVELLEESDEPADDDNRPEPAELTLARQLPSLMAAIADEVKRSNHGEPIGSQMKEALFAFSDDLRVLLDGARYEGVKYDDDPGEVDDERAALERFRVLRDRATALGYELLGDDEKWFERSYSVLDPKTRTLFATSAGLTLEGVAKWLDEAPEERACCGSRHHGPAHGPDCALPRAATSSSADVEAEAVSYTLLRDPEPSDRTALSNAIYSVRVIGRALQAAGEDLCTADRDDRNAALESVIAHGGMLVNAGRMLERALGSVQDDHEKALERAIAAESGE